MDNVKTRLCDWIMPMMMKMSHCVSLGIPRSESYKVGFTCNIKINQSEINIDQPLLILSSSKNHPPPVRQPIQTLEMSYSEVKTLTRTVC